MTESKIQNIGQSITTALSQVIAGQQDIIEEILIALVAQGHVLIEGVPGVGKTLLVKTLASLTDSQFNRIQFTPDLMPSDILGNSVFNFQTSEFVLKKGPIFTNFLLADEINRTPPKTQAALLEAMEERQVTIDVNTFKLDEPFMVFATQNPIEHEGTYQLPEAQLDRFLMKLIVKYPARNDELEVLKRFHQGTAANIALKEIKPIVTKEEILNLRRQVEEIVVQETLMDYVLDIITATRNDHNLMVGASPRASLALLICGKAIAALHGRAFVTPDDIKRVALPVLRHRVVLKPEAEIEGLTPDQVLLLILDGIEVPR
jgi:MoxR-like ATPase